MEELAHYKERAFLCDVMRQSGLTTVSFTPVVYLFIYSFDTNTVENVVTDV